jgi:predicted phage terminase large subunit-like protein
MGSTAGIPLDSKTLEEVRQRALGSLYFFAKGVLGFSWLTPHIHGELCKLLEDPSLRRLVVVLPRGWLKTTVCSIAYPLWRAIQNPNVRVLLVQNTYQNAVAKLRSIDGIIRENALFRALWPELLPDRNCVWKSDSMALRRPGQLVESTFEAAGIRTQVVSRHYDEIIEDDTVAPDLNEVGEENIAPTKEDIEQAIGWHRLAMPLLVDVKEGRRLVVGTRWFQKDLISWVREHEPSYKCYERAVLELDGAPSPAGTPAYPERFDQSVLDELRSSMGPYMYSCLYMNMPLASEDMTFRKEWFQFFETEPQDLLTYTTVDPAGDPSKAKSKNTDYCAVVTTGKDLITGRIYVLDYTRQRLNPGELIDAIFKHVRKWHPVKVGIESVAYQNTLEYWVRERMRKEQLYFLVSGITGGGRSKETRIRGLQPLVMGGMLAFRPWMSHLLTELESFPLGSHDDVIDALAMQLELWAQTKSVYERRKEEVYDPLSLDAAVQELQQRRKSVEGGKLYDVLRERPGEEVGYALQI